MNMDEILRNMNSESGDTFPDTHSNGVLVDNGVGSDKVEDMWSVYVADESRGGGHGTTSISMTLEDLLEHKEAEAEAEAGALAVVEEDIGVPSDIAVGGYEMDAMMFMQNALPGLSMQNSLPCGFAVEHAAPVAAVAPPEFGNGMVTVGGVSGGGGRGKRKVVEEVQVDKATQQKQRRMIKNRESAARSRERKQAYTVELEALVSQLEEENARLLKEEAELTKQRYQQLMEKVKPVVEKRKPARIIHKWHSTSW